MNTLYAPYWRLYWIPQPGGPMRLFGPGQEVIPDPDALVLIPARCQGRGELRSTTPILFFHFALTPDPFRFDGPFLVPIAPAERKAMLQQMMEQNPSPHQLTWHGASLIGRALTALPEPPPRTEDPILRQCLDMMRQKLGRAVPNAILCKTFQISEATLCRMFRKHLNTSPQQFYIRLRVDHACHLLTHTKDSLENIADSCGFWDRFSFSRSFKDIIGMTPAQFRKRNTV